MITEGHLARHYQGQRGGRGPAIIDIAQDHLLAHLAAEGIFDLGIALKGGTAIRKFRAGNQGRFSTDLDFAGLDDAAAELLLDCVDGAVVQEGLGDKPFDPEGILRQRKPAEFDPEAIGHLTKPVDMVGWIELVRGRFAFLRDLDDDLLAICRCSKGDEWLVGERIKALRDRV